MASRYIIRYQAVTRIKNVLKKILSKGKVMEGVCAILDGVIREGLFEGGDI